MEHLDLDKTKLIDKYLNGELSESEKQQVENKMKEEPEFAREVKFQAELMNSLKHYEREKSLREEMKKMRFTVDEKMKDEEGQDKLKNPGKSVSFKWYWTAASVLLLSLISFVLYYSLRTPDSAELFRRYYAPFEPIQLRGNDSPGENKPDKAFQLYHARKYAEAASLFKPIIESGENNAQVLLIYGICSVENKQFRDAADSFAKVIEQKTMLFDAPAKWYLGLCYLKLNEREKALQCFSDLQKSNSSYRSRAEEIVKALK